MENNVIPFQQPSQFLIVVSSDGVKYEPFLQFDDQLTAAEVGIALVQQRQSNHVQIFQMVPVRKLVQHFKGRMVAEEVKVD